jgi:hypothetical protein
MKRFVVGVSLIMALLGGISCDDSGDHIISSRDHDIKTAQAAQPSILANGISTTEITATVVNKNKTVAPNMKVHFKTTHGTIDEQAVTDANGIARATLTSEASEQDITAAVTATVVDTMLTPLNKAMNGPFQVELQVTGFEAKTPRALRKSPKQQDSEATIYVKFLGVTLSAEIEETVLPADGLTKTKINVNLRETTSQNAIRYTSIQAISRFGSFDGNMATDEQGRSQFYLVSAARATLDTLKIEYGKTITKTFPINFLNPKLEVLAKALQAPADGESTTQIVASLISPRNTPIIGAEIKFSTSAGVIPASQLTDANGQAIVNLISGREVNTRVMVVAKFHSLSDTTFLAFLANISATPNSILLEAKPNYIWVKETGNIDQAIITATILDTKNQPVGNDVRVKFRITNSPNGGEYITPSAGGKLESSVISTAEGKADATIRAGIRSGTVQIRAELVDYPQVVAQTTNLVIRSGPPYMWVNPANANDVIPHATLAIENGKYNVAFGNPIQDIKISGYFGDKYNNPVEEGTAVYFTTTGGFITSDALTNNKGQTTVILQNVNPFPVLVSPDSNQLTALNIRNPNDDTLKLNLSIPDFEGGLVRNSKGTYYENDGIAVLLAYTWGQDQNGQPIKVWATGQVVYSVGVLVFDVRCDSTELRVGSSATIRIRLYDANGNPVAAGSSMTVTTTAGELSETNLMPPAERYGYGQTSYQVSLTNNLDPTKDKETTATVKVKLDSPNGSDSRSVNIKLKIF